MRRRQRWRVTLLFLGITAGVLLLPDCSKTEQAGLLPGSKSHAGRYLWTDRWRADARTALAVADYLLSPDNPAPVTPLIATNHQGDDAADQPLSATNAIRVEAGNPS